MESLAVKYRPHVFEDALDQKSVIEIMRKQLETRKFTNCYLFAGASGCGKTTLARIFANEINRHEGNPIEIDGASNNGVENVRNIIEEANSRSIDSEYKIFIIDECVTGDTEILTDEGYKRIDSLTGRNYIQKINELFYPLVQMGLENLAFINTKYIADIEAYILAFRSALNNISKQLKSDIDDLFNYFDDFNSYCLKKYFYEAKDIVKIGTYDDMATVVEKFNLMYESYKKLEFYL